MPSPYACFIPLHLSADADSVSQEKLKKSQPGAERINSKPEVRYGLSEEGLSLLLERSGTPLGVGEN